MMMDEIIERIMRLTDEQVELLTALLLCQEDEIVCQAAPGPCEGRDQ